MTRLQLIVLFFSIVASVARGEQGPSSASASGTVSIVVPAVAGITIPSHVSEAAGGGQSIRFATFSSSREGGIALVRNAAKSEIVLASNRREKGAVALQSGWSVNDHRLPPGPVRTSGGAQRITMEVWQF